MKELLSYPEAYVAIFAFVGFLITCIPILWQHPIRIESPEALQQRQWQLAGFYLILWGSTIFLFTVSYSLSDKIFGDAWLALNRPVMIVPAILGSFVLFWIRGRFPVLYGLTEVTVGALITYMAIVSATLRGSVQEADGFAFLAQVLGLLGGIYIVVRGLDNVEKGLPPNSKSRWMQIFIKKR